LRNLASALSTQHGVSEVGGVIEIHLDNVIPFSLLILYIYNSDSDELVAEHIGGDAGYLVGSVRIARGEHLSGWVAANRRRIVNSDPMLDLGEVARGITPPLRSCLSVPLISDGELIGVLSLYASVDHFDDEHCRIIEVVAEHTACALHRRSGMVVVRA
jgi:GAF domain-containing protein